MIWSAGAVSVTFHNVIVFQCHSLYFITHLARFREVMHIKYQLKQTYFVKYIKFDELLSEIDNVLQKGEFNSTLSA